MKAYLKSQVFEIFLQKPGLDPGIEQSLFFFYIWIPVKVDKGISDFSHWLFDYNGLLILGADPDMSKQFVEKLKYLSGWK